MDLRIGGKSFVVVGGSRGMGWETCRVLAQDGANVAVVSRNPDRVGAAAQALAAEHGVRVLPVGADVLEAGSVDRAIAEAVAAFGDVAGLAVTHFIGSRSAPFVESEDSEWTAYFEDVTMGTVRACRAVLPHLIARGGGTIVTTSAYSARAPKDFLFAYASQKAAVINLTKNLAKTYGAQGIRANCVCPGAVETARSAARLDAMVAAEGLSRAEAGREILTRSMNMKVGLQRFGQPDEVADMIAFLLSGRAAYANGMIANVDGGTDF